MLKSLLTAVMLVALCSSSAVAQQVVADVKTWSGQSLRVSEPTFEVFYTIMPSVSAALGGGGAYAPGSMGGTPIAIAPPGTPALAQPAPNVGVGSVGFQAGTAVAVAQGVLLPEGPPSKQGRRQQEILTVFKSGVETHIPVANITNLTFTRTAVGNSPLPPYVSPTHFRHAATVTLADGSKIQADYVNMGTAILRGASPNGTIDIPWDDIEVLSIKR
jgi:hypothetical protein